MKNKKIFISIILFVTILLISTICHASQVSYDISDYNNYIDGKVYAIVYSKENERSINYLDPKLGINWNEILKGETPILSEKDKNAKFYDEIDCNF